MTSIGKLLFLSVPAMFSVLALLELGVLGLFVPIDDFPREAWDVEHKLIRYAPKQSGTTYPSGDLARPVPYTINATGWSSSHPVYPTPRGEKARIAVIGDSYVAAFQVAPAESISARLESRLGSDRAEVFAFGMNGAPLSQSLHVARHVAQRYRPDAIVIVLVHNDFDESYRPVPGRYTSSFLRLRLTRSGIEEIPPEPYQGAAFVDWVRTRSTTFRFLYYRLGVGRENVRALYFGLVGADVPRYEANVDVTAIDDEHEKMWRATRYLFQELSGLSRSTGVSILLVMDTPRHALYEGRDPSTTEAFALNRMAAKLSREAGLSFLDLTDAFRRRYASHQARFEFATDGHWNAAAHDLAAREACARLTHAPVRLADDCARESSPSG